MIKFSQLGARVVVLDIDDANGNDLVNNISNNGGLALFVKTDVSEYDQVERAFAQIVDRFGSISILVNNAGICNNYSLMEINPKSINRTVRTNLLAHFWTVKLALPKMFENKKGECCQCDLQSLILGSVDAVDFPNFL